MQWKVKPTQDIVTACDLHQSVKATLRGVDITANLQFVQNPESRSSSQLHIYIFYIILISDRFLNYIVRKRIGVSWE